MGGETMLNIPIDRNCAFIFSEDIELMFAAQSILMEETVHDLCSQIYGHDELAAIQRKYPFLHEVFKTLPAHAHGIFEHLLTFPLEGFTLNTLCRHLLKLEPAVFLQRFFDMGAGSIPDLARAIAKDHDLEKFYFANSALCTSFLGFQSLVRQTGRFIAEYFSLAEDLRTEAFSRAIRLAEPVVLGSLTRPGPGSRPWPPWNTPSRLWARPSITAGHMGRMFFVPAYWCRIVLCAFSEETKSSFILSARSLTLMRI